jgi:hypothetical protein
MALVDLAAVHTVRDLVIFRPVTHSAVLLVHSGSNTTNPVGPAFRSEFTLVCLSFDIYLEQKCIFGQLHLVLVIYQIFCTNWSGTIVVRA